MKKEITLGELAKFLGGELIGNSDSVVSDIQDTEEAGSGDLAFIPTKRLESLLENTKATCVLVPLQIKKAHTALIRCANPNLAFKKAAELILPGNIPHPKDIHKTAYIGKNVTLGRNVSLGAYACIEDGTRI